MTYAVCAGNTRPKHLRCAFRRRGIAGLDALSVRDDATERAVLDLTSAAPHRHIDPAFLHHFGGEIPPPTLSVPYMLVYTYGLPPESVAELKRYAADKGLRLVVTGAHCPWADENPVPSPFAWLSLMQHSAAVATSTFHGAVFSMIFRKPFAVLGPLSSKLDCLLNEMDLSSRAAEAGQVGRVLDSPVDCRSLTATLPRRIAQSRQYLLDQLTQARAHSR